MLAFAMLAPLLGAAAVALMPRRLLRAQQTLASAASVVGLASAVVVAVRFAPVLGVPQQLYDRPWLADWGIRFTLAVDGLSLGLVLVASLTSCAAVLMRHRVWTEETHRRETTAALLLCQSAVVGLLSAQDVLLAWVCWSTYLLGLFFLVGLGGGARRLLTSTKVALCGFCSLTLMLVVFVFVAAKVQELTGQLTFAYETWARLMLPADQQNICLALLLVALALAMPLLPLQGWWGDAHGQAAAAGAVALFLGPGIYGLIRFALPLFPLAAVHALPYLIGSAALGSVVAAVAAPFERDFRRRLALVAWAQTSLAAGGAASMTPQGLAGALVATAAATVALAGLALSADPAAPPAPPVLDVDDVAAPPASPPGGAPARWPRLPTLFALSTALVPGLGGFSGALLIVAGLAAVDRAHERLALPAVAHALPLNWLVIPLAVGGVLSGALVVYAGRGAASVRFLRFGRATAPLLALAACAVLLGLWPRLWLARTEATVGVYLSQFARRARHAAAAPDAAAHFFPDDRTPLGKAVPSARPQLPMVANAGMR